MNLPIKDQGRDERSANKTDPTAIDPVCGMTVGPQSAAGRFDYQGKTYYFCSAHCLQKFRENPERFTATTSQPLIAQPVQIRPARTQKTRAKDPSL